LAVVQAGAVFWAGFDCEAARPVFTADFLVEALGIFSANS
jgi:hypothetical protein